jgi:hypothetical protein
MVTDFPQPNDWILLSACVARMGELHRVYRFYPGYAQRDLEAVIRGGRAALRGRRPGQADHTPETIGTPITSRHRIDPIYNALSERSAGPFGDNVLFRDVETDWNKIKGDLREFAIKCWPTDEALALGAKSKQRKQLTRERAKRAIEALYPTGVPDQSTEPNSILCRNVGEWLKKNKLPDTSEDTILRAAGRRK